MKHFLRERRGSPVQWFLFLGVLMNALGLTADESDI